MLILSLFNFLLQILFLIQILDQKFIFFLFQKLKLI